MKFVFRLIKGLFLLIVLLLAGGLALMFIADPVVTSRMVSLPFGGSLGPAEPVPGGQIIDLPSASADNRTISDEALADAIAFGEQHGTHALIVYQDGYIQAEHYYPGYSAEHFSATQSMHKSVLAILVGIAIEQGHIASVDEPAATYLTEWANDGRAKITIRQMLQQSSGIDFPTFSPNLVSGFFQLILGDNIQPVALDQPLDVEPGSQFDYNSVNPQNLGLLIQRATGKRYAEYLSEALWQRLGAPDAAVTLDSTEHRMARMFCCLNATARSWLHIGLLHLNNGRSGENQVVSSDWMQQMVTPGPHNPNYGYLTWLGSSYDEYRYYNRKTSTRVYQSEPYAAPDVIFFDGFGGQRVYIIPSRRMIIVRTGDIAPNMDDAYLPNVLIRGIRNAQSASLQ